MLLQDRWQQVTEGRGQAVLIAGEAGIGKSRLVQAFREHLAERPHTWLECRSSPYNQDSPLFAVVDLARLGLGIRPGDAVGEQLRKLERGLGVAGFPLAEAVPVLAAFLAIPLPPDRYTLPNLSPEGLRKKTLGLLSEWVLRLGRLQPLVLLMEDLHWLDPSMVEFLGQVLEQVATESILVVLTHRPDFEPPWGARSHLTPMLLSRLARVQLIDLIRKVTRGRALDETWLAEIAQRSDGVRLPDGCARHCRRELPRADRRSRVSKHQCVRGAVVELGRRRLCRPLAGRSRCRARVGTCRRPSVLGLLRDRRRLVRCRAARRLGRGLSPGI